MLLTIAIPTYNRSVYLAELLRSIYDVRTPPTDFFEIYISDNCSTDNTSDVCKSYALNFNNFNYRKNVTNVGANANIAIAANLGAGQYVWVLGDDDIIPSDGLINIVKYLKAGIDYLMLNHTIFNRDMNNIKIKQWYFLKTDKCLEDRSMAMRFLGPSPSFISAIIAKRSIINSLDLILASRYITFGFNQLYAFYKGLPQDAKGVVTQKILLNARGDNSGGDYDWNHYFVTGLGLIFRDLGRNEGYSPKDVRCALAAVISRYHIRRALNEGAEGRSRGELRRLAYHYYKYNYCFWLILFPVTFLPTCLMRQVKKIKKITMG